MKTVSMALLIAAALWYGSKFQFDGWMTFDPAAECYSTSLPCRDLAGDE
jgi:hypothetical protein